MLDQHFRCNSRHSDTIKKRNGVMEKIKAAALYFIDSMFALWLLCSAFRWDWINLLDPNEKMYLISFIFVSTLVVIKKFYKSKEYELIKK